MQFKARLHPHRTKHGDPTTIGPNSTFLILRALGLCFSGIVTSMSRLFHCLLCWKHKNICSKFSATRKSDVYARGHPAASSEWPSPNMKPLQFSLSFHSGVLIPQESSSSGIPWILWTLYLCLSYPRSGPQVPCLGIQPRHSGK